MKQGRDVSEREHGGRDSLHDERKAGKIGRNETLDGREALLL